MSIGIVSKRRWLFMFFAMSVLAGCDKAGESARDITSSRADTADNRRFTGPEADRGVIRVREDLARGRLWVLTLNEVRIYSVSASRARLLKAIALPNWSVVGLQSVCMPDIALDRTGSAFISSNNQARLLRIDADRFNVDDYAIGFRQRSGLDTGFGALAFGADGTLFARTTPGGRLWKIDVAGSSASPAGGGMQLPADPCAITTQETATQLLNGFAAARTEHVVR